LVRELRAQGLGLIFISHAVEEALRLSDRITVLRDGQRIVTASTEGLTREDIIRHMVGRSTEEFARPKPVPKAQADERRKVLSVQNVTMGLTVKNMSFNAYEGEILAIAGLVGSGRTEIAKIIAGALKRNWINGGLIYLDGKPIRYRIPQQAIKDGIVYITEDRKINGFFETMRVDENVYIGRLATKFGRRFLVSGRQRRKIAQQLSEQLSIHSISPNPKVIELSGGNQQKVVIAKSLVQNPRVIIFDEPTRGVDVGAIPQIHQTIRDLAAQGKAVIVISSYLPEILALGDRILVARNGRIAAELPAAAADEHKIMRAAIH
jgi:ABC-type sugar transport system ATPase subunit